MKKFYLLVLLSCLGFQGYSTKWYSSIPGDVTVLANWSLCPLFCTPSADSFTCPTDTFYVISSMWISGGETWNVAGTVIISPVTNSKITKRDPGASSIHIGGPLYVTGASKINSSLTTDPLYIYLNNNLVVSNTATISPFVSNEIDVHFTGVGTITWTSTATSSYTNIIVDNGAILTLGSNVPLPVFATSGDTVSTGGTLNCGTYSMSGGGSDVFTIEDGARIYTANAGGLDSSLKQMSTRVYSQRATYEYDGTVPQVTGVTLPDTISVNSVATGTVIINNPSGVSLSKDELFNGSTLDLELGTLTNGTHFNMISSGNVNVDDGTFASAPTYQNDSITVTYESLGSGATAVTTGFELLPISTYGNNDTIGNVYISYPAATITLGSSVLLKNIYVTAGTLNAVGDTINVIDGNFTNNESTSSFVPGAGSVLFLGASGTRTFIGGTASSVFNNLTVNRPGVGIYIADNETINNTLTLTNGRVHIYQDTLFLDTAATAVAGTLSSTAMIVADSTGMVAKVVPNTDNTSYLFPIGDRAGHYAPVTYSNLLAGGAYIPGRYLAVNEVPKKPTVNANTNNYLNRYWNVYLNNFPSATYAVTTNFLPADVTGSYTLMSMGEYTGALPWIRYNPATATTLTTPATVSSLSSLFSGIGSTLPTITSTPSMEICNLAPVTLNVLTSSGDAPLTYSWAPSTGLSATTGTSVVLTPSATGVTVYTVTITDGNGFTAAATTAVTVNPAPVIAGGITNSTPVCVDGAITFGPAGPISNVTTYSWSGPGTFSSGDGTVSPIIDSAQLTDAGDYVLTVTNGPGLGCSMTYTTTVVVNDTAAPVIVTGGGVFCNSASVTATGGGPGNTIFYEDVVSLGTGITIDESTFPIIEYTSGTYYFRARTPLPAGCWGTQSSVTVTINPLPDVHVMAVVGEVVPGFYCAGDTGIHIVLSDGSDAGISYQVYHAGVAVGAAKAGTGTTDTLDMGLFNLAGNYAIVATNTATGCTNDMISFLDGTDSILVTIVPLPDRTVTFDHAAGADGGYCPNVMIPGISIDLPPVGITGFSYQLFHDGAFVTTSIPSDGSDPVSFGTFTDPGVYRAVVTDATYGCVDTLIDRDSIWINPLPNVYHVTGHDTECADGPGFFLGLSNGDATVQYAIYENLYGTGPGTAFATVTPTAPGAFSFTTLAQAGPATPGDYYYMVVATNVYGCVDTMADSGNIHVNPLPFDYGMSGGGQYCADSAIASTVYIYGTDPGFNYQLYNNGVAYGPVRVGTGDSLTWGPTTDTGTYSVVATNPATGCYITFATTVRIQQNPRPNIYAVSGGGTECADGPGFMISLPNSDDATVTYYLYENGSIVSTLPGTSGALSFGPEQPATATPGNYTYDIVAVSAAGCYNAMTDSGYIHVNALPGSFTVTGGGAYCINDTIKYHIGLSGSETGIQYQLYRADTAIRSALHGTGVSLDYGLTDTVATYTIVATNPGNTCTLNMLSSATITANTLPTVEIVTGGGSYCYGTGGLPVGLASTQTAPISYQLYDNGTAVGTGVTSTGGAITFGAEVLAGTYTVSATNTVTGCKDSMANPVHMIIKPLPAVFTIAGGGSYCTGDTGRHIYLSGSIPSVKYTLLETGTPIEVLRGTGFGLDYGVFTSPALSYMINAVDTVSGCSTSMAGSVSIFVNPLPQAWNVTGGGIACAGTGFPVNLANSNTGVRYQLYRNSVPVGTPVAGTTGSSIDFGTETISGTYTVIGTDVSTLCANKMIDSATVELNPLPVVFPMTGGGTLCAGGTGHEIGLANSEVGVTYQMYTAGLPIGGPQLGTGSAIEFGAETLGGTYFAVGVNATTGCTDTMRDTAVIIVNPLPTAYDMNGGGTYCISDSGVHVGLTHSDTGILYQLNLDGFPAGSPVAGTGDSLDFGLQTASGTYTVSAIRPSTGCTGAMSSTESVTVVTHLTPVVTLTASQGTNIAVGQADTLIAHVTGAGSSPTYQWYINGNPIPGATRDTFFFNSYYFDLDSIVCAVTSHGLCGDITTNQIIVLTLYTNGVQQVAVNNSDIKLAPNPNKGAFTVKGSLGTTADEEVEMEITDMLGQAIYKTKVMATGGMLNEQIHLGNTLANGMYLLNVRTATQSHVFHFVMEQ